MGVFWILSLVLGIVRHSTFHVAIAILGLFTVLISLLNARRLPDEL